MSLIVTACYLKSPLAFMLMGSLLCEFIGIHSGRWETGILNWLIADDDGKGCSLRNGACQLTLLK
jgi:hypothetical protein